MIKFRKKPIVIEALQWRDTDKSFNDMCKFIGEGVTWSVDYGDISKPLYIWTLEGKMRANQGDWIIKGVNGEFSPCKQDIFEITYEPEGDSRCYDEYQEKNREKAEDKEVNK